MRLVLILCAIAPVLLAGFSAGHCATIYVPDDYPTIQDALDAAVNGDEIIVRPGSYVENIDFLGKEVALRSEQGPLDTQIHGGGPSVDNSAVSFENGEGLGSIIEGFGIINGYGDNGGGIRCIGSSPTILRNVIIQCHSNFLGGGIYCENASPRIAKNTISNNTSGSGGGIYCDGSSPFISRNTINDNSAHSGGGIFLEDQSTPTMIANVIFNNLAQDSSCYGGGIVIFDSSPTVTGNTITFNKALHGGPTGESLGGGIFCTGMAAPNIDGNNIAQNEAYTSGGGIACTSDAAPLIHGNGIRDNRAVKGGGIRCENSAASLIISRNRIFRNEAAEHGGAISLEDASPTIELNAIRHNRASGGAGEGGGIAAESTESMIVNNILFGNDAYDGGGIWCGGAPNIVNNTIYSNTASYRGGGVWCSDGPGQVPVLTNNILWANSAAEGSQIEVDPNSLYPEVTYCDVEQGWPGTGNIAAEPLFADADRGDFHLSWNSPCRDAGDTTAPGPGAHDMEGDPRVTHASIDLGADEFHAHLYVVNKVVPGNNIELHVVGQPDKPVTIAMGSAVLDPPILTQHGYLYIPWPPVAQWKLGPMPAPSGLLTRNCIVPSTWSAGDEYPFQALVGKLGDMNSVLTNLLVLEVE